METRGGCHREPRGGCRGSPRTCPACASVECLRVPSETDVADAGWVVSGQKGIWAQDGVYSEDCRGSPRPEGELARSVVLHLG